MTGVGLALPVPARVGSAPVLVPGFLFIKSISSSESSIAINDFFLLSGRSSAILGGLLRPAGAFFVGTII